MVLDGLIAVIPWGYLWISSQLNLQNRLLPEHLLQLPLDLLDLCSSSIQISAESGDQLLRVVHEQTPFPRGWGRNLRTGGSLHTAWELLKLGALEFLLVNMAEVVKSSLLATSLVPVSRSPPRHVIEVLVILHLSAILLTWNTDHHCH